MNRPGFLSFAVFYLYAIIGYSQSYPLGLNPSDLKWKKIETDKVEVIFPENIEDQAQRVANLIDVLDDSSYYSLGEDLIKTDIILQNQGVTSNGFVTVGPFRSEFYTNGPQLNFSGNVNWMDLLTIHEYRHIQQFTNARKGVTKLGSILLGEYTWGLMSGLALPRWFFEGDAVFTETYLTNAGRGRTPEFENEYKALLLENQRFGYEKASATSLKNFVPNHYNLGYHMVAHVRQNYGDSIWEEVLSDAVKYEGLFYPFNKSLKKKTGMRSPAIYKTLLKELDSNWNQKMTETGAKSYEAINSPKKKRTFISYRNPRFLDDENIIAEKSGFNQIPTYVLMDKEGNEKNLFKPGLYSDGNATLQIKKGYLVWSQNEFDPRWGNKDYSVIMLYDIKKKSKRQLTSKTRYFAPKIAPDGRKIVAIHSPTDQNFELHLIDITYGATYQKLQFDGNYQFSFPEWIDDNNIAVVVKQNSQNSIGIINVETGKLNFLTPFYENQLSYLVYHNGIIYFQSYFNGTDNIYAFEINDKELFQVTNSKFGAIQPDINTSGEEILFSDYSWQGYNIVRSNIDNSQWIPIKNTSRNETYLTSTSKTPNILNQIPEKKYEVQNFSTAEGLINFHSWYPIIDEPNFGIELVSNNKMTTLSGTASVKYNLNEDRFYYGLGIDYGEKFFAFEGDYEFGKRSRYLPIYQEGLDENDTLRASISISPQEWNEHNVSVGAVLPLNLTVGNMFSRLWISNYAKSIWVDYEFDSLGTNENFGAYEFDLSYYLIQRTARQHIRPRLGLSLDFNVQATIATSINKANSVNLRVIGYLPGVMKTHSFYVDYNYNSENLVSQYKFRDSFFYARGYNGVIHDDIWRIGFNYELPLFYPDIPLGPFAFFKRFKANLFFDISQSSINAISVNDIRAVTPVSFTGSLNPSENSFTSTGIELTTDFRFLRVLDIDLGVRYSRLLEEQNSLNSNQFQFILRSIGI